MGVLEDSAAFATNFLTQIFAIIATGILVARYIIAENRKHNERLSKKILGPEGDGKGGMLYDMKVEYDKKLAQLEKDIDGKISDGQRELLFEFQKTAMRINYMSRNFGRMEKSLERITGGKYTSDKTDLNREEDSYYNENGDNGDHNMNSADNYNQRKRGKGI